MHAHPSDLLRFAREGRLYDLLTAYRPDVHVPHWGQLLDAASRSGRVSVVVWLIRLRALQGKPCDPVAVLPLDADSRVVEVCRQIREVDEALEYHLLIQEQRRADEARFRAQLED